MEIEEFRAGLLRELNAIDSKYAGLIKNDRINKNRSIYSRKENE